MTRKESIQTWEEFQKISLNRKIFLFGMGKWGSIFISQYHNDIKINGMIDNDVKKQGRYIGDYVAEAIATGYEKIVISDISILKKYKPEEVVILITNKSNYEQIVEQLEEIGLKYIFIYFMLEDMENRLIADKIGINNDKQRVDFWQECCKQAIINNKIVVSIGNYGGHGKYITEELLIRKNDLDIVWIVNDLTVKCPKGVRVIYGENWKKIMHEMATARIWIFDVLIPEYVRKRNGQIYIQTKHWSSITLKKFFLDDSSTTFSKEAIEWVQYNGKIMDYIFTGSEFDNRTCRSGFAFQGEFVQIGSARTDAVFRLENRYKVYEKYNINKEIHSAIYAPTFRFSKTDKKKHFDVTLDYKRVKETLEKRFGGKWVILLRIHPSLITKKGGTDNENFLIDVSDYYDSQELVAASEIMISDYSSIMFEPAFVQKPVFLFAPDKEQYVDNERELLINYDSLPFPLAETIDELIQNIECFNESKYKDCVCRFMEQYSVHEDGHASERAAQFILKLLDNYEEGETI